jgi:hypothetical protein
MRRLLAIGFVWLCCAGAWAILGSTLAVRSDAASGSLSSEVHALWGPPLAQAPPSALGKERHRVRVAEQRFDEKARRYFQVTREDEVETERPLVLDRSEVDVRLALEHRRKGLLWFPTYGVSFQGRYALRNDSAEERRARIVFPIEPGVTYDGFAVKGEDGAPIEVAFEEVRVGREDLPESVRPRQGRAAFERSVGPGEAIAFTVAYRARGTERWSYGADGEGLGPEKGRARNFRLTVATDFDEVDFPAGTLSPSDHRAAGGRWEGTWRFEQIVGTKAVGVVLPEKLNPGPLAAKLTFFAPVSLLFFFFVTGMLLAARGRSIHPMSYFLLACAFFAFHLLFAYLIDHVAVGPAFAAASVVSIALVVSYARHLVGWRTASLQVGTAQLVYLVLFSVTFFWKGYTGLAITIGAILTLFVIMQLTGRTDWERALGRAPPVTPAPSGAQT